MKIKIIFETQTGTTQYVAEVMQKGLTAMGHQVDLHSVRYDGAEPHLENYDVVLFGAPTYEDGKIETTMRVFLTRFTPDLSKHKVAVFGLGNSMYPQFCIAADVLKEWVEQNHGVLITPLLRIDGFPDDLGPIQEWVKNVGAVLQ